MACFLVPTSVGLVTTALGKKFPENWHVGWLNIMIFGGAVGLAVEHYAHGEIAPWFPFLTAMGSAADTAAMFKEMAAVGIPMTIALIAAWAALVLAYNIVYAARKARAATPARS